MNDLELLQDLNNRKDVANLLGVSDKKLIYILYAKRTESFYTSFEVSKGNGGIREINAPLKEIRFFQDKLKDIFSNIYALKPRKSATGFLCGKSIIDNAKPHLNSLCILNIDFKDFFNQINFGRVLKMLEKGFNIKHDVAVVLTQILTVHGKLPQGSPSSPIITNLICSRMDNQLEKFSRKYNIKYTRYADDLTFSTKNNEFNHKVCEYVDNSVILGEELIKIFEYNGFEVNPEKLFIRTRKNRQEVTGLVINEKLNVRKDYVKNLRAALHNASKDIKKESNNQIYGKLQYLRMIKGEEDKLFLKYACQYNDIFGEKFSNAERLQRFNSWLSDRIFVIDTYQVFDEKDENGNTCKKNYYDQGNGTGFNLKGYGFVSCYHVIENLIGLSPLKVHRNSMEANYYNTSNSNLLLDEKNDVAVYKDFFIGNKFLEPNFDFDFNINEELTLVGYPLFDFEHGSQFDKRKSNEYVRKFYLGHNIYKVDCEINHGSSGGPVLDKDGRVVGIITNGCSKKELYDPVYGFVPIKYIKSLYLDE